MAHGIGGIKAGGLAPFAERFREEGFAAIAFDYRNFGGSGGQPREVLSVPRQRADYSTVIGWAVFVGSIFVMTSCPLIRSASNFTLSPGFTAFSKFESGVEKTVVLH